MIHPDDDVIYIQTIEDEKDEGTPVVGIAIREDGSIHYESTLSPLDTYKLFHGLAEHILENVLNG